MDKDYDKILKEANNLLSDYNNYSNKKDFKNESYDSFKEIMIKKYEYLHNEVNSIFIQCIEGNMDIKILKFMITQAKEIQKNNISNHDASVKVGEKLVDKFIKPMLDKNKGNIEDK